jgi:hypothetical protein
MSDKFLAWLFGISAIATTYNTYLSNQDGNFDATLGWITATCFSLSALGAYLKLINKNK